MSKIIFSWVKNDPIELVITPGPNSGKSNPQKFTAAYLAPDGKPGSTKYLQFTGPEGMVILKKDDILNRACGPSDPAGLLANDLKSHKVDCEAWDGTGNPIVLSPSELNQNKPLFRQLAEKTKSKRTLKSYADLWAVYYTDAVETATQHGPQPKPRGTWDVSFRYFRPASLTTLYIVPADATGIPTQVVRDECQKLNAPNINALCISDQSRQKRPDLVKFSISPLGLYTTWIDEQTLSQVQEAQCIGDDGEWTRELPSKAQTQEFNEDLVYTYSKGIKADSTVASVQDNVSMLPKESRIEHERINTKLFMGDSANEWACTTLGWKKDGQKRTRAEWLHLIAHRFEEPTGDRFSNIFEIDLDKRLLAMLLQKIDLVPKLDSDPERELVKYVLDEVSHDEPQESTDDWSETDEDELEDTTIDPRFKRVTRSGSVKRGPEKTERNPKKGPKKIKQVSKFQQLFEKQKIGLTWK
ncbi:hypothetical protein RhiJN_13256 [Ceratobasidium sp. AG-Ba]|nr:hypothetical protein RhiJN_13256 [Ceratobasidium sp. AG-Ba]QRW13830.1 hypothetical protein RhiLY_12829 [Ceratobasidium sp. AG-Ba]